MVALFTFYPVLSSVKMTGAPDHYFAVCQICTSADSPQQWKFDGANSFRA